MRCENVRRALPLLSGTPDEEASVREHLSECADCKSLQEAYGADARALAAVRSTAPADREVPPIMAGFADSLMQKIAEEPVAEAEILRPEFGRPASSVPSLLAAAAVLLVTLGLGFMLSNGDAKGGPAVAETPLAPVAPPVDLADLTPDSDVQPLAAPRRLETAPMPRLQRRNRRRGIVPVDGSRNSAPPLLNMLRDLQRVFPNWSPNGLDRRVPPLRKTEGEREVRF